VKLEQKTALTLVLSQEMQLSLKILQMNAMELSDYYTEVLIANPAADLSILDRPPEFVAKTFSPNHSGYTCLSDLLKDQVPQDLPSRTQSALFFLIEQLNDRGFLADSVVELAAFSGFSVQELESAKKMLHSMDPAGIGAASVQECLLLQLERQSAAYLLETEIIQHHMNDVAAGNLRRIATVTGFPLSKIQAAVKRIQKLNPIPANGIPDIKVPQYIIPELRITSEDGKLGLQLNHINERSVEISPEFMQLLTQTEDHDSKEYMKEQLAELRAIRYGVRQRNQTLTIITEELLRRQANWFLGKSPHLQPLSLEDLAEAAGVTPSTVSRAIHGKYLLCDQGVFPYKHFLSRKLPSSQDNNPQSSSLLESLIRELIASEDPTAPYSDKTLCDLLEARGVLVARRTITKYRERLGIPVTYLRRNGL